MRLFLKEAQQETEQGGKALVDAILQVSVSANRELYERIRRDDGMCQALRELMKDEIQEDMERSWSDGWSDGQQKGQRANAHDTALRMLSTGRYSMDEIAFISGISQEEIQALTVNDVSER